MQVLIVGSGGREHALAWKLKQSSRVEKIYIAPGNPGTDELGENISAKSTEEIVGWLRTNPVGLVVIGPDQYLAEGLSDKIRELGILVFGPSKAAAEIEWSKTYAKQLMLEEGIPTAQSQTFSNSEEAKQYVRNQKLPIVIKADGLAAGKGVIISKTIEEAESAIEDMMESKVFGDSGSTVIIEDYLDGVEISVHAFCDGEEAVLFPIAKDHKRICEGDTGPNTGGMGTIAPVSMVTEEQIESIRIKIVLPILTALKNRGRPFSGVLFPGVMLTKDGPFVIEFNARFGDPETQSYMRILESDLFEILYACATGRLAAADVRWSDKSACCIVLAAKGYPTSTEIGDSITILPFGSKETFIFDAGVARKDNQLITNGGRVLGVTAVGDTLSEALEIAYGAVEHIDFPGKQFRRDIGASVVNIGE
jgi:phosphoribosylamine--glycine ligase